MRRIMGGVWKKQDLGHMLGAGFTVLRVISYTKKVFGVRPTDLRITLGKFVDLWTSVVEGNNDSL